MEELLNEKVINIKFGVGIIIGVGDKKITVKFDKLEKNKLFQYPDAFEYFFEFENKSLQHNALKQLQDIREKAAIDKEKNRLEYKRQYEERKKEELELAKKERKEAKSKVEKKK